MAGRWVLVATILAEILCGDADNSEIMRARVELAAAKYTGARDFIVHDLPLYHNVQRRNVEGMSPTLFLINKDYEYTESFPIHLLTREEINDLLKALGFYKKDIVPDSYMSGPYVRDESEMTKMYSLIEEKEREQAEASLKENEEAEEKEGGKDATKDAVNDTVGGQVLENEEKSGKENDKSHKDDKKENQQVRDDL